MKQVQLHAMKTACLAGACMLFSMVVAIAQPLEYNLIKNGKFTKGLRNWTRQGSGQAEITGKDGTLFFKKKDTGYVVIRQDVKISSLGAYSLEVSADNRNMPGSSIIIIPFMG